MKKNSMKINLILIFIESLFVFLQNLQSRETFLTNLTPSSRLQTLISHHLKHQANTFCTRVKIYKR